MSQPPLLSLRHVSLVFSGVNAVTDIGFEVKQGEICSLIGPNGAGKSSLLNVVSGVYRPTSGSIVFDGEEKTLIEPGWAARRGIARTFQNIALFKKMTVLENLLTGQTLATKSTFLEHALRVGRARADERVRRARAEQVAVTLELVDYLDVPVGKLAYGLQKRVEFGRALVSEPRLILLDEPFAGMNFEEKLELSRLIADWNASAGTTVLLIEHDMGIVMDLSHHVVVLDYGRKIADGAPREVRHDARVIDAYLGTEHDEEAEVAA